VLSKHSNGRKSVGLNHNERTPLALISSLPSLTGDVVPFIIMLLVAESASGAPWTNFVSLVCAAG
jgi:hypothetical protein